MNPLPPSQAREQPDALLRAAETARLPLSKRRGRSASGRMCGGAAGPGAWRRGLGSRRACSGAEGRLSGRRAPLSSFWLGLKRARGVLWRFEAQVDFFEGKLGALPPGLRQNLDKVAFLLLFLPVAKRLADCSGQTCGF